MGNATHIDSRLHIERANLLCWGIACTIDHLTCKNFNLTRQNLGRVLIFRSGCMCAMHLFCQEAKQPNLKLKARSKQLLGSLLMIAFVLPMSAQGRKLEYFKWATNNIFISKMKILIYTQTVSKFETLLEIRHLWQLKILIFLPRCNIRVFTVLQCAFLLRSFANVNAPLRWNQRKW